MKSNQELIGKTITGIVAVTPPGEELREIWMLQFSDGTHLEFVSPEGKRILRRSTRHRKAPFRSHPDTPQLRLNVA